MAHTNLNPTKTFVRVENQYVSCWSSEWKLAQALENYFDPH